ncbi:hypothetical protein HUG10_02285 [Halorarum halophilum]|uniref:Uncharacterized protein n=1 Tax=Halorarum halophilum TaxID=2743090 RepID=A0A7D5KC54_9EURY|nr:hypothetical protein [Halobaculum halophilum]QLG26437.1 hypothetical protein HUG10_02285 [Halobaculum halophilum]
MSSRVSTLRSVLTDPARASRRSRAERSLVVLFVGLATGLLAAMAHYVTLHAELAPAWVSNGPAFAVVLLAGVLAKLLAAQMRTSAAAIIVACAAGLGFSIAFEVAPYYLLGIDTLGGYAVVVPIGEATLAFVGEQFPLQFLGYILGVVYHGVTA